MNLILTTDGHNIVRDVSTNFMTFIYFLIGIMLNCMLNIHK